MSVITITNGNQLPRWLFEPLPNETVEQAAARIQAKYPGKPITVYMLKGRAFIQHPEAVE